MLKSYADFIQANIDMKTRPFTFDGLIAHGIFRHPRVADFRLGSERLGSVPLPDPAAEGEPIGGRTYKRALELLILANALADPALGDIVIDDGDGKRERPDFRVSSSAIGEIDVEVTQLRSEATAKVASAVQKLQDKLRAAVRADSELLGACTRLQVSIAPWPNALLPSSMDASVAAFVDQIRGQIGLANGARAQSWGIVFIHEIDDAYAVLRGVRVSAPLPRYGQQTDIDVSGLVNRKRCKARGYRRADVPLWLVIGVTADFGQLEVTVDNVLTEVVEIMPFDRVVAVDGARIVPVVADPERAQHDLLGRAWHEAGHAVAAATLGIPIISTTIERSSGSENGFTEVEPGFAIAPLDDALFTAAGAQAQLASTFSPPLVVKNVSLDDRLFLEHDVAVRAGVPVDARHRFADEAEERARTFVAEAASAIDTVARMLLAHGTVSGARVRKAVGRQKNG